MESTVQAEEGAREVEREEQHWSTRVVRMIMLHFKVLDVVSCREKKEIVGKQLLAFSVEYDCCLIFCQ